MDTDTDKIKALANSLDLIPDEDFCALARIVPGTSEAWRKRGKGPDYILLGNRYLYPRKAVAEFLETLVRKRVAPSTKGQI